MFKFNAKTVLIIAVVGLLVMCLCGMSTPKTSMMMCGSKTSYMTGEESKPKQPSIEGTDMDELDDQYAPANLAGTNIDLNIGCAMNAGVGLASSLLPREMASQEDFGQFAPQEILEGQNFLDPRNQIGYPETLGGALRNANQQIRAEPPNPKQAYVWSNSTIVPDLMQRKICT
jgi:hypothetical protein